MNTRETWLVVIVLSALFDLFAGLGRFNAMKGPFRSENERKGPFMALQRTVTE